MNKLELKETRYSQYFWNIIISLVFLALLFIALWRSDIIDVRILAMISPFHFILVALATFRLTRLLVADHITEWLRDLCMEKVFIKDEVTGSIYMRCEKPIKGVRRAVADLFSCPWCMGVWMACVSLALYYLAVIGGTLAWIILLIFAIAGVAEIIYAFVVALMTPIKGNFRNGQTQQSTSNVCTDCGSEAEQK